MKRKIPLFDAHCDTLTRCLETGEPLWKNTGALDAQRLSLFSPAVSVMAVYYETPSLGLSFFLRCAEILEKKRASPASVKNLIFKAGSQSDSCREGAEALEYNLDNLKYWIKKGVKIITLTWNNDNDIATPWLYEAGGLGAFGKN